MIKSGQQGLNGSPLVAGTRANRAELGKGGGPRSAMRNYKEPGCIYPGQGSSF